MASMPSKEPAMHAVATRTAAAAADRQVDTTLSVVRAAAKLRVADWQLLGPRLRADASALTDALRSDDPRRVRVQQQALQRSRRSGALLVDQLGQLVAMLEPIVADLRLRPAERAEAELLLAGLLGIRRNAAAVFSIARRIEDESVAAAAALPLAA
jgi:hypothetical protein